MRPFLIVEARIVADSFFCFPNLHHISIGIDLSRELKDITLRIVGPEWKVTIKEFVVAGQSSEEMLEALEGTLYVTNYRVVMEKKISSGGSMVIFQFPLEALRNAETKGVFSKTLSVEADLSQMSIEAKEKRVGLRRGTAKFSIKLDDPKAWAAQLSKAIADRRKEM